MQQVAAKRTFVTEMGEVWNFAVDRVGNIQVCQGNIEPIGGHVTGVQYIFWRATQVKKHGIAIPAGARIAGAHVVLFQE